jgi:hypothetical protein
MAERIADGRIRVEPGDVSATWRPALDQVWAFIRRQPGLWADGHIVFLHHHSIRPEAAMACDFGVEVTRPFEAADEVYATETPAGHAVVAIVAELAARAPKA